MPKVEPTIQKYMTPMPHFIAPDATLPQARKAMDDFGIRHLPIVEGMRILGIVSDRDLKLAMGILGANPREIKVIEIFKGEPFVVEPSTSLREAVITMSQKQVGSVMVAQNGKLVGILTRFDVCKALGQLLEAQYK